MSAFGFAVLAAFLWGSAAICEKMGLVSGADPLTGLWARCIGVVIGTAALSFLIPQLPVRLAAAGWKSFFWLAGGGLIASVLGQFFFYRALKVGEIGRIATVGGSWPLVAFLLSLLFLHEAPTPRKLAGVVLVFLGVTLLK
ncbi:MAG TPA: EamA family transporter [Elusimicrobiota bacterium]|nr:EamA family transporter [Elusimicrobiota bacterium]